MEIGQFPGMPQKLSFLCLTAKLDSLASCSSRNTYKLLNLLFGFSPNAFSALPPSIASSIITRYRLHYSFTLPSSFCIYSKLHTISQFYQFSCFSPCPSIRSFAQNGLDELRSRYFHLYNFCTGYIIKNCLVGRSEKREPVLRILRRK